MFRPSSRRMLHTAPLTAAALLAVAVLSTLNADPSAAQLQATYIGARVAAASSRCIHCFHGKWSCMIACSEYSRPTLRICAPVGLCGCMPCHGIISEVHLDGSPTVCTLYCTGKGPMPGAYAPTLTTTSATPPTGMDVFLLWALHTPDIVQNCTCLNTRSFDRSNFQG
jgi:hypothetical protein